MALRIASACSRSRGTEYSWLEAAAVTPVPPCLEKYGTHFQILSPALFAATRSGCFGPPGAGAGALTSRYGVPESRSGVWAIWQFATSPAQQRPSGFELPAVSTHCGAAKSTTTPPASPSGRGRCATSDGSSAQRAASKPSDQTDRPQPDGWFSQRPAAAGPSLVLARRLVMPSRRHSMNVMDQVWRWKETTAVWILVPVGAHTTTTTRAPSSADAGGRSSSPLTVQCGSMTPAGRAARTCSNFARDQT
mmetsp:Transcript_73724/g.210151  ORF Transcript_73724/g.210151 Transcript_73724/m.210151 type:complete len:249 (+) Transcript_73724:1193-1939(+)